MPDPWKKDDPGCECCGSGCSATITFVVKWCVTRLLPGASVHVTGPGGYNSTLATNSMGGVSFAVTADGSYPYTITHADFTTATGTVTISGCASQMITVLMGTVVSSVCCDLCDNPVPATLFATAGGATVTLTYNSGIAKWFGVHIYPVAAGDTCDGTGLVEVDFFLTCPKGTSPFWNLLVIDNGTCNFGGTVAKWNSGGACNGASGTQGFEENLSDSVCARPISLAFTAPSDWGPISCSLTAIYPPSPWSGSIVITE